ncbi:hypothetical protein [Nonomuraea sp. NPDC049784]|uniref:hypothetical protein n=1 Tax=Nonomuraea sp. NPDC049784 TaxID=3154361 RepID=UPI0033F3978A
MPADWQGPVLQAPDPMTEALIARDLACRWRAGTSDRGVVRLTGTGITVANALHAADRLTDSPGATCQGHSASMLTKEARMPPQNNARFHQEAFNVHPDLAELLAAAEEGPRPWLTGIREHLAVPPGPGTQHGKACFTC